MGKEKQAGETLTLEVLSDAFKRWSLYVMLDRASAIKVKVSELLTDHGKVYFLDTDAAYKTTQPKWPMSFDPRPEHERGIVMLLCAPQHEAIAREFATTINREKFKA